MHQDPLAFDEPQVLVRLKRSTDESRTYEVITPDAGAWRTTAVVITGAEPTQVELRELGRIVSLSVNPS